MTYQLHLGDCLSFMQTLDANSVDAVVTDPPAGISFMGKAWDSDKGGRDKWIAWMSEIAAECLRVLKPGGYALVWSLPRTSHWMGMAWENGGFEPRDRIAYCFGSGFPKSLDVSKAIDKAAGAKREVVGKYDLPDIADGLRGRSWGLTEEASNHIGNGCVTISPTATQGRKLDITAPATAAAVEWAGWGTALKPAIEDWWIFRKPLSEVTVAANVLRWGTGALNIDASRIEAEPQLAKNWQRNQSQSAKEGRNSMNGGLDTIDLRDYAPSGRWPANLITDGSPEVVAMFPQTSSEKRIVTIARNGKGTSGIYGDYGKTLHDSPAHPGGGSASRFFAVCPLDDGDYTPLVYMAKASRADRSAGLDDMPVKQTTGGGGMNNTDDNVCGKYGSIKAPAKNFHPTCKSTALMRYLITLCTREGATVLDPFLGSGTTLVAAIQLGRNGIGCESNEDYFKIAEARIAAAARQEPLVMTQ